MSNLLNDRIEGPNNQEPVLGTDERAIIFKTPISDNLVGNLNMNGNNSQALTDHNLNFRVALDQDEKSHNI